MKRLPILPLALIATLLAGCDPSDSRLPPPGTRLPAIPADIRTCFKGVVEIPDRDLTVGDVEKLWKQDRVRAVVSQRCGTRLVGWYGQLRSKWK